MEIYIPKHLRENIVVLNQLSKMIEMYGSKDEITGEYNYYISPTDSFDKYRIYKTIDPVRNYISFCIKESDFETNEEEYNEVLNYLCRLFYSVKGTRKVFDYMKKYLGVTFIEDIDPNPNYTVKKLEISIGVTEEIKKNDTSYYYAMRDFLSALLYFEELDLNIAKIYLPLEEELTKYFKAGIISYKDFQATGIKIRWIDEEGEEKQEINFNLEKYPISEFIWTDENNNPKSEISFKKFEPVLIDSFEWKFEDEKIKTLNFSINGGE